MVSQRTAPIGRPHRNLADAAARATKHQSSGAKTKTPTQGLGPTAETYQRLVPQKPCPFCGSTDKDKSGIHRCEVGPTLAELRRRRSKRKTQLQQPPKLPKIFTQCPICNVRLTNLEKHQNKVHPVEGPAATNPAAQAKNILLRCVVCGVMVKSLAKHYSRTGHGKNLPGVQQTSRKANTKLPKKPLNAGQRGQVSLSEPVTQTVYSQGRDQQLDAKHQWGGTFRDHGQFGSYPSHDGMDDESFA